MAQIKKHLLYGVQRCMRYCTSLIYMVGRVGIEPTTSGLKGRAPGITQQLDAALVVPHETFPIPYEIAGCDQ